MKLIMEEDKVVLGKLNVKDLKPFIRWAGGKQNLIDEIFQYVDFDSINTYFEPFLGGGSFFLKGNFNHSYLSDLNPNLINCYLQIKKDPEAVYDAIQTFKIPVERETYYKIREDFNECNGQQSFEQAIRFLFLNRTSFNGIYRVNRKGHYNVPFGKPNPAFPSLPQLVSISKKLESATIFQGYYDEIGDLIAKDDFIYLDPPYPRLSDTAYFNHYTLDQFDNIEQEKVAQFAKKMSLKDAKVLISNADLPDIRELYKDWNIFECSTYRYISCKKVKVKVKELIICNY
jgi:DNA adenine methylase